MLTVEDLTGWLESLPSLTNLFAPAPPTVPVAISPESGFQPPDIPGRLVVITITPGGPTLAERTIDQIGVQLLTRGDQGDPAGAEALAWAFDDAVMGSRPPFPIGQAHCSKIDYRGGPPRWLVRDPARRHHWSANYVFNIARTVF